MITAKTTKKPAKPVRAAKEKKIPEQKEAPIKKEPAIEVELGKEPKELKEPKDIKYFEAIGRRKRASARVRLFTSGKKEIIINDKDYKNYFPILSLQKTIESPLEKLSSLDKFGIFIKVSGGGISAQAEACRHGISRALVLLNPYFRKRLKKSGYLTRDSRRRERKKFGLKRARRAPQFSKR